MGLLCVIIKIPGMNMLQNSRNRELAPCGVFCGACPSFGHTCLGCPAEDHNQKRISKWSCKIRRCCYETKQLNYCIQCAQFPCQIIQKKLLQTHGEDPRFVYRHEITRIFPKLLELGEKQYHQYQISRWTCPGCGGRVVFYEYRCPNCGATEIAIE